MSAPAWSVVSGAALVFAQLVANRSVAPAVPRRTTELLERHCTRCHDGSSVLDLRAHRLPARGVETWAKIRSMVETGQMPPSDDSRENAQGMAPGERQELVNAAASLANEAERSVEHRTQIDLSLRDWSYIVREVAAPFLSLPSLEAILARRRGLATETKSFWIALDVCTVIMDVDSRRSPSEKHLPGSGASHLEDPTLDEFVKRMFELVYRESPSTRDSEVGRERFRRFEARSGSSREASIALCTSYLTGLRLRHVQVGASTPPAAGATR